MHADRDYACSLLSVHAVCSRRMHANTASIKPKEPTTGTPRRAAAHVNELGTDPVGGSMGTAYDSGSRRARPGPQSAAPGPAGPGSGEKTQIGLDRLRGPTQIALGAGPRRPGEAADLEVC